jgi:hypothetical protein
MAETAVDFEGPANKDEASSTTHVHGSSHQDKSFNFGKDIPTPTSA